MWQRCPSHLHSPTWHSHSSFCSQGLKEGVKASMSALKRKESGSRLLVMETQYSRTITQNIHNGASKQWKNILYNSKGLKSNNKKNNFENFWDKFCNMKHKIKQKYIKTKCSSFLFGSVNHCYVLVSYQL